MTQSWILMQLRVFSFGVGSLPPFWSGLKGGQRATTHDEGFSYFETSSVFDCQLFVAQLLLEHDLGCLSWLQDVGRYRLLA